MKKYALVDHLRSSKLFNQHDIDSIESITTERLLKKGEFLIRENQSCEEISYVVSGFLHSFYWSENLDPLTYCIAFPNHLVTAYSSFMTNQVSPINIQALTSVELKVIPKARLEPLLAMNNRINQFFNEMTERYLVKLENRFFQIQKDNARSRYLKLMDDHPEFILNVPQKLLASYLGITPRHLSRIRSSLIS